MITWATLALLITAAPIAAWRWGTRRDRRETSRGDPPASGGGSQQAAHPQRRPSWAAAGGHDAPGEPAHRTAGADRTAQTALGGRRP
ncbi:glycosyl transferase [Streptomyces chrestomyceticus JCM 4735]|uniref:Glycosyl transferase n=2 Tax=Streptomyces chrestomyceticus TaxID=68185 RepID=A0A7U9KZ21_9ACTN|nr:glycosyl transferase [Streptomyces chrestomyceticus JCM 4735]